MLTFQQCPNASSLQVSSVSIAVTVASELDTSPTAVSVAVAVAAASAAEAMVAGVRHQVGCRTRG